MTVLNPRAGAAEAAPRGSGALSERRSRILVLLGQRLIQIPIVLLVVSMLTFWLIQLVPGDPGRNALGQYATAAQVHAWDVDNGLTGSVVARYLHWLTGFMLLLPASGPGWRLALFAAGSFVVLAGAAMSGVITVTFRSTYIPAHLLGRVTAATRFVVSGAIPLGAATAGALATAFGTRNAMWAMAILFAVTPLPLLATSMRTLRDFPTLKAPA